ncbi:MAG: D-amino-acid dehydrogenase [Candidatus Moranbacteria bacterium GW2011_GWF2_36_839]|nr:MAG: D-amino-acid dehydrogenase [Candidatus Moranbacteria bacterium GW2011_GWF1_36_78]KKQ17560.1 MAG: D-amino-acid dehydrogenase [Candidatus Moranbacteria bacterium GW2011_GWF2_36_839]
MLFLILATSVIIFSGCGAKNSSTVEQKTTSETSPEINSAKNTAPVADTNTASAENQDLSNNTKCDAEYDALISKYGKTYEDCYGKVDTATCDNKNNTNKKKNLVLILDSSGSMAPKIGGKSKIEIAKEAALNFVKNLNEEVNVSIIAYGHKGSNSASDKAVSCAGIEEIYWLDKIKLDVITSKVSLLQATGWTPIADSLQKASDILAKYPGDQYQNSVLLISDGEETCGGNPVSKAKELNGNNIKLITNVIGFNVGGTAESQLKNISQNGGGVYYSARSSEELNNVMNKMSEATCAINKVNANSMSQISVTNSHSSCTLKLGNESTNISLGIRLRNEVSDECQKYVSDKYDERHKSIEDQIAEAYNEGQKKIDQAK